MDVPPRSSVPCTSNEKSEVKSPLMSDFKSRFTFYHDWQHFDIQQPYHLANAAFFNCDADAALVECYHCGLLLNHWTYTDSPMVEHIRHRPECGSVLRKYSRETRNYYGTERDAQLTKDQDFMNIEGRPTFSRYLLWNNFIARQGVQFSDRKPTHLIKWRAAEQRDAKEYFKFKGYETVERRLRTMLHPMSPVKDSATALKLAQDGIIERVKWKGRVRDNTTTRNEPTAQRIPTVTFVTTAPLARRQKRKAEEELSNKRLNQGPDVEVPPQRVPNMTSVPTAPLVRPSKRETDAVEEAKRRHQELQDETADESFVTESEPVAIPAGNNAAGAKTKAS
ncbi:hypothetical protein RvY_16137 [Ramazzottius varieornatus]|uniref:BIR-domain-containing protein n=1 Tax=Ramazzottius varieornatus TaxID=947166 RepID=A0A1D1VXF2_RAMVA|nr:hypothetical protein RvY_16137 [Ramazzottius varieornatus]